AGCCFGVLTDLPWGVTFPQGSLAVSKYGYQHLVHPTQLYSSINGFLLAGLLLWLERYKKFDGQLFWLMVLLYSITRFSIEFLRGDPGRGFVGSLSTSQFIGVLAFCLSIIMLTILSRIQKQNTVTEGDKEE
ncbi:MAG: prolipoprotein diacylglyceryl transferase, partial [bacterium]|nr:prolipoprotein diacylglyceryl transferase [bacterium]